MDRNTYLIALGDPRLPPQLLAVDNALVELNLVLVGDGPDSFNMDRIWPTGAPSTSEQVTGIETYFAGLTTDTDLKNAINTLLSGAPSIKSAVDAVFAAVQDLLQALTGLADGVDIGDRLNAFVYLDNDHPGAMFPAADPAVSYGGPHDVTATAEPGGDGYGFFPAIENLVAAAGGPGYDTSDVLAPLNAAAAVLAAAGAIAIFTAFATGTLSFLTASLDVD